MKTKNQGWIALEGMKFFAHHGYYKKEREEGNHFVVDLFLKADLNPSSLSDNLNDTINYELLYQEVKEVMSGKHKLLEHLANLILTRMQKFPIMQAKVRVTKLKPPIAGDVEKVSVELERIFA